MVSSESIVTCHLYVPLYEALVLLALSPTKRNVRCVIWNAFYVEIRQALVFENETFDLIFWAVEMIFEWLECWGKFVVIEYAAM